MQQAISGLDVERAVSAMAGMPEIQKAMTGLPNATPGDQKADVLRTLSFNLDSMVATQAMQQPQMVQGYQQQRVGLLDRSSIGAGATPFGNANLQQSGFQGTSMSRASSCPAPGVLLRTTSISNRKTAPNRWLLPAISCSLTARLPQVLLIRLSRCGAFFFRRTDLNCGICLVYLENLYWCPYSLLNSTHNSTEILTCFGFCSESAAMHC